MHSAKATTCTLGLLLIVISAASSEAQVCDVTGASPLIQKSDCALIADYLENLGQSGQGCGVNAKHDEQGCTIMNIQGSCTAKICDPQSLNGNPGKGQNCAVVAGYFRIAYNGCAADGDTLHGASCPIPASNGQRVTATATAT